MNTVLALATLLLASAYDLRERRVPNRLILCAMACALASALLSGDPWAASATLLGAAVGLLILLPFFALGIVGAGDVKLMGVVGSFFGVPALLPITLYTFIAGGVLGLAAILILRSGGQTLRNLRLVLWTVAAKSGGADISLGQFAPVSAARIPYALAIAAGVVVWLLSKG